MGLVFNRDFEPRYGEAVPVAPGVRRITAPNAGPFTFQGTNTFIIGEKAVAVLDPGPADTAHIEAVMRAIGGARVAHILVSHAHRDHSAAAPLLKARTGAPVLAAAPATAPHRRSATATLDAGTDEAFAPDRVLADGDIVETGWLRLEAVATPGHASDHLVLALLGENLLFSGDHVMGWATTVVAPPDGSMIDYMASLDRLLGRPEKRYLPAHGGEIADGHAHVRALRTHRRMRERAILDRLRRGDRFIPDIVRAVYRSVDVRLAPAATLSTLAHLEALVARGLAVADGVPDLDSAYSLAESRAEDAADSAAVPGSS